MDSAERNRLLAEFLDGNLSEEDSSLLLQELQADEDFQDGAAGELMVERLLGQKPFSAEAFERQVMSTVRDAQSSDDLTDDVLVNLKRYRGQQNRRTTFAIGLAAAAVIAVGLFITYQVATDPSSSGFPTQVVERVDDPEPPTAVLTRAIDVEWSHKNRFQADVGNPTEGWLNLDSGVIEVTFSSGATVTAEGPGRLRIDSPLKVVSRCRVAVHCPPSAYGFTVDFEGGKVIDLGTEFAIDPQPEGRTQVHVIDGEVIVALTNEEEVVLKKQNLTDKSAVTLDPASGEIKTSTFDSDSFKSLQRSHLLKSQPIKLQFDLGHRAGVYRGIDAPGHAAGDFFAHENHWTQIVGDQSGTFVMADGNVCPHPIKVDYGHGDGEIDWDATPVDPWGKVHEQAQGIFKSALCQDHRPWDEDLGLRVSGLPAGTYRVYALCRSARRPGAFYEVSFGTNLDRQLPNPIEIPPMDREAIPQWEAGVTYEVEDVEVTGEEDGVTFITRYSRERSVRSTEHHGRSVLLGLQIVQIR